MQALAMRLVRLYPRRWRERYGDEFLATVADQRIGVQQIIDIVVGAADAHLSWAGGRGAAASTAGTQGQTGGRTVMHMLKTCDRRAARYSSTEALIGAGVLIGATVAMLWIGISLDRSGYPFAGEVVRGLAFPLSFTASMPFTMLKGQPVRAQIALLGFLTVMLTLISVLAAWN